MIKKNEKKINDFLYDKIAAFFILIGADMYSPPLSGALNEPVILFSFYEHLDDLYNDAKKVFRMGDLGISDFVIAALWI